MNEEWLKKNKILLNVIIFFVGIVLGWLLFFQVPFLYRVLPHGGF